MCKLQPFVVVGLSLFAGTFAFVGGQPRAHWDFLDDPEDFRFAIVANLKLDGIFTGDCCGQSNTKAPSRKYRIDEA